VERPCEYKFSSYSKFIDQGFYSEDWGINETPISIDKVDSE
jgi:hypothetical protein